MATSQAAQKEAEQTISDVRRERFRVVGAPTTPSSAPTLQPTISVDDAPLSDADRDVLDFARDALISESRAILDQIERLDRRFCDAVALLTACSGSVVVTGMGKAGLIGRKISATLSSTGTPSHFLHPAEAFHGDLGTVRPDDVVLALSYSGETEELSRILAPLRARSIPIVSIVSSAASSLGRASTLVLEIGSIEEADALRLAPSSSAAAMLAVGDALALAASRSRKFRAEDFAKFHPGGSLGRRLSRVDDLMRPIAQCRVASDALSIREIFVSCRKPGRRVGAILLTDAEGRLTGVFTDSDLAKLFETREADFFDRPISEAMTRFPSVVRSGALMSEAIATMSSRKISELPVLDERGVPLGILDVTDLVDFFPTPFEPTN
ncbi:MAG: KpsF/GutQ family sugar-phosphate isomerase [Thermoguttaceae bacterium]|nr:KpsF/GutQ family sugar-phosphate isomerase [Thermoguttaceae bacterium]